MFICFGVWAIFLVYWQKIVRVSKKQPTNTEKSWMKKKCGKIFLLKIIFGFRAEKFEQLVKKNSQDCQNSIQSLQRNIFRTFLWNEETLFKVFGSWAKIWTFCRESIVKFLKTAAYGNSRTFWGSFGEKSNSLIVFGPWAKNAIFWQKKMAGW